MIEKLADAIIKVSEGASIAQRDIEEVSTIEEHGIFTSQLTVTSTESPYTITPYDGTIFLDSTGGVISVTLPTAVGIGGRIYAFIDNGNAASNNITVNTTGGETISGASSYTVDSDFCGTFIQSDGVDWYKINCDTIISQEYMYAIWAEENSTLGDGTYEWAFGDGAITPSNNGIAIYVPTGWAATIVAMSCTTNNAAGKSVIEASISGVLQGALCDVTNSGRSATNDSFTPVSLVNNDRLTFRTTTAGVNSTPNTVTAWIRMVKT